MTASQLNELITYSSIEPFGEQRAELRHGQTMALTLNLNRDSKSKPEPFTAADCMNYVIKAPKRIYSAEELEAYAKKVFGC